MAFSIILIHLVLLNGASSYIEIIVFFAMLASTELEIFLNLLYICDTVHRDLTIKWKEKGLNK